MSVKQTAYFSLIHSFIEYGATVWNPYQKYKSDKVERVQHRAARFVKSRYSRYSSVSDMRDVLGWPPLSQRRQGARFFFILTILLTVWHKCPSKVSLLRHKRVLEENTILNLDILAIQLASIDARFFLKLLVHGKDLLWLKLHHWLYLDQIFLTISVHPFRIIP